MLQSNSHVVEDFKAILEVASDADLIQEVAQKKMKKQYKFKG